MTIADQWKMKNAMKLLVLEKSGKRLRLVHEIAEYRQYLHMIQMRRVRPTERYGMPLTCVYAMEES